MFFMLLHSKIIIPLIWYFRVVIVLKEDFDKLKNILLFKEKEEFLSTKNNIELYKNKKNSIISQLIFKNS